jgi:hypothetical protein
VFTLFSMERLKLKGFEGVEGMVQTCALCAIYFRFQQYKSERIKIKFYFWEFVFVMDENENVKKNGKFSLLADLHGFGMGLEF